VSLRALMGQLDGTTSSIQERLMRVRGSTGRRWVLVACSSLMLAGAPELHAQTTEHVPPDSVVRLRGRVVDSAGVAVPEALVGIAPGGYARTSDREGRFEVVMAGPGTYTLRVRVVGYAPATQELTLAAGEAREVVVRVRRFPVTLSAVEVRAERHSKHLAGILRRQSIGHGRVLFAEDLARYNYVNLSQALGNGFLRLSIPPTMHRTSRSFRRSCSTPMMFIDGQPRRSRPTPKLEDIEAIETHRSVDFIKDAAEFSYGQLGSGCPVILVWTKTGLRHGGR
jgi:hypothetical protein